MRKVLLSKGIFKLYLTYLIKYLRHLYKHYKQLIANQHSTTIFDRVFFAVHRGKQRTN